MNNPVLKKVEAFPVQGLQVRTLNADEANPTTAKLPVLWGTFFTEYLPKASETSKSQDPEIFGVYFGYESDHHGYYNLLAGLKTENQTQENGQACVLVQSGSYLVFNVQGAMPHALIQEWVRIWEYFSAPDCEFERSYTTDFEQYLGPESVAIHIAIKDHA
jgi:predicted transcriptional regulator YdeE